MDFKEGDLVYFMHPEHSWIVGTVQAAGKTYTCKAADEGRKVVGVTVDKLTANDITMCRDDVLDEDVNDLLQLTVLHDSTLLRCLYVRYMKDIIYTNIGAIVVALNPFNFKIPRYMDDQMVNYLKEGERIEVNLPHSWAQAHNTYNEMMSDRENQCVLISGESGAGKTEATKIVLKYLAAISCRRGTDEEKVAGLAVGTKLASCSPILEAFGNARTVRNNNSSRFGKFMKVKFSTAGILVGAHTTKYLLEKSRIITASPGERVYHAFYVVARGEDKGKFELEADTSYRNLTAGNQLSNPDFDTAEDYAEVKRAMLGVGMTDGDVESVFGTTAGIMSLINLDFVPKDQGCEFKPDTVKFVDTAIKLWKVNGEDLKREIVSTTYNIKGEITVKQLNPTMAADVRDGVAKALYDATFQWLVDKCNQMCDVDAGGNWVGALDIFGFEDFEINSFEQICINLANETLQNHYNTFIFSKDMEECRSEGIDVTEVKCPDNSPCLNMVSAKGGVLALLDEECAIGDRGSDLGFLDKVVERHQKNPFFEKKKLAKTSFIVKHYAGNVSYEVAGWLEKNRDSLKDAVKLLMRASQDELTKVLLPEPVEKTGKPLTVGGFFKTQVQALMDVINSTNPHWIRCIKPHPAKKPLMLSGVTAMSQLESSGVLGTVKIRKAGYPIRTVFDKFCKRYAIIVPRPDGADDKTWAEKIITSCDLMDKKHCQMGITKVFMKSESLPTLERARSAAFEKWSFILQRFARGYRGRLEAFDAWFETQRVIIEEKRRLKAEQEERERKEREAYEAFMKHLTDCEREEGELRAIIENDMQSEWDPMFAEFTRIKDELEFEQKEKERIEREERERREAEERRLMLERMLLTSSVLIQKVFRGFRTRQTVFREEQERLRARVEYDADCQLEHYRGLLVRLDDKRHNSELVHHRNVAAEARRAEVAAAKKAMQEEKMKRDELREKRRVMVMETAARREADLLTRLKNEARSQMEQRRRQRQEQLDREKLEARQKINEWEEKHQREVRERWSRHERAKVEATPVHERYSMMTGSPMPPRGTMPQREEEHFHEAEEEDRFDRMKQAWIEREDWVNRRETMLARDLENSRRQLRAAELLNDMMDKRQDGTPSSAALDRAYFSPMRTVSSTMTPRQQAMEIEGQRQRALQQHGQSYRY